MTACLPLDRAGYRMEERGLTMDDVVAKMPGPPKSKTSYQAYFKSDYVRVAPDWVLNVVMEANDVPPSSSSPPGSLIPPPPVTACLCLCTVLTVGRSALSWKAPPPS